MKKIFLCLFFFPLFFPETFSEGTERVRLGVVEFISKTGDATAEDVSSLTDAFANMLSSSQSIEVIRRDWLDNASGVHKFSTKDMPKMIEAGRLSGCKYMVLGAVTRFDQKESSSMKDQLQPYSNIKMKGTADHKLEDTLTVELRAVDTETSEVILSLTETKIVSSFHSDKIASKSMVYVWEEGINFRKKLRVQVINEMASLLANKMREAFVDDFICITDIAGKNVTINRGTSSGIKPGDLYRIYVDGEEVLDIDGSSLGKDIISLAVIKVNNVNVDFSSCEVVHGRIGVIRKGDKAEEISQDEVEKLIKKRVFPDIRQ